MVWSGVVLVGYWQVSHEPSQQKPEKGGTAAELRQTGTLQPESGSVYVRIFPYVLT
jgi:hypothetical protein